MADFDIKIKSKTALNVEFEQPARTLSLKNQIPTKTKLRELNDVNTVSRPLKDKDVLAYDIVNDKFVSDDTFMYKNANNVYVAFGDIIPYRDTNATGLRYANGQSRPPNLGTAQRPFGSLFLSGNTIVIGNLAISDSGGGTLSLFDATTNVKIGDLSTLDAIQANIINIFANTFLVNSEFTVADGALFTNIGADEIRLGNALGTSLIDISGFITSDLIPQTANTISIGSVGRKVDTIFARRIAGLSPPEEEFDAVTKAYLDDKFSGGDGDLNTGNLQVQGTAELNILTVTGNTEIGEVHIGGPIFANGQDFFANNVYVESNLQVNGDIILRGDSLTFGDGGDVISLGATVNTDIIPTDTNTYSLGSSSFQWHEVHASRFVGDGSGLTGLTTFANNIILGEGRQINDGAVKEFANNTTIYNAIDLLNEAIDNVRNETFVRSVDFSGSPLQGGVGTTVTLTLDIDGVANRFDVDWGDGTTETDLTDSTPSHTYNDNADSPFTVVVTARNSEGYGETAQASATKVNYITIFTADPVPRFTIHDELTDGSIITEANTGQSIYLENTSTGVANDATEATYTVLWGDSTSDSVESKVSDGGDQGARLEHSYSADSGSSTYTITLRMDTHSTATPGIFPLTETKTLKVFDISISAPNNLSTKTISWASSTDGFASKLAHGFTDNSSSSKSAGDPISSAFPRFTSGTVTSSNMSSYFHTTGSVTQEVNDTQTGSPIVDESGVDYYNYDASGNAVTAVNRIYPPNLYETGTKARVSYDITGGSVGVNKIELSTSEGNSNELFYVYDNMTSSPTVDLSSATLAEATVGYNYISGVPYYDANDTLTLSGVVVTNLTGQTYKDDSSPFTISSTNVDGTGTPISSQAKTYSNVLGASDITSNIPNVNLSSVNLEDITVTVGSGDASGRLTLSCENVNGSDIETLNAPIIQAFTGSDVVNESAIPVSDSLGSGYTNDGRRLTGFVGATPSYSSSTDYYSDNAWSGAETVASTDEAIVRYGALSHFAVDLSSGYLPVGPDLSTGRSGTQYFRFAFKRSSVSNFRVRLSGKVSGFYYALPASSIDSASTINGWIDASVQYNGSGIPGADTGNGGNGSNGGAFTGADRIVDGTTYNNSTFDLTFGTESTTNSYENQVLISIALNSDDSITSLSIEDVT